MASKTVRIGGASAFATDSATGVPQLLRGGKLDYMVFDYLAEGSMCRLANLQKNNPDGGFAPDFIDVHMRPHLAEIMAQKVKIIANAGAVNPKGCAAALQKLADELGLKPRIAYVAGDDLRDRVEEFRRAGTRHMFDGSEFPKVPVASLNAYLGGFPIANALARGADIVITGRVVDSAPTLGALIHEFGWRPDQWDLLSAGTVIGHLLECGTQVTGGTHTDWRDVGDWSDVGFPIAECAADGSCILTKPANTGGLVSVGTVTEQLLYEVSDPRAYFVPDVVCDFSTVKVEQAGPDRVRVSGATGRPATATYKVCVTYEDGFRAVVMQPIIGMEAAAKAERQAKALIDRTSRMLREQNLPPWRSTYSEVIGAERIYGARGRGNEAREVIVKVTADHDDAKGAGVLARECHAATTAMAVGTSIGFPAFVMPIPHLFSFLLPKREVKITVTVDGKTETVEVPTEGGFDPASIVQPAVPPAPALKPGAATVPVVKLAWGRSGDKGDLFNVAIIARKPDYLPYIRAAMTPEAIGEWYAHLIEGERKVERFEVTAANALNFVVHNSLGGGITSSPKLDPVAKGMAQQLLEFPIPVPDDIARAVGHRAAAE